ncbi:MAG: hypothetical protein ABDI19_06095 [Armatimonadota bacterium]
MRGWLIGLALIVVLNGGAVLYWHHDEGLWDSFENLDVRRIVARLEQPHQPLAWFVGDWVLGNGFYRPLPSLLYELDYRLWGRNLLRYKWLNGLLSLACALMLVAWVWELSRSRPLALLTGFIFTGWQTGLLQGLPAWLLWGAALASVGLSWRLLGDWRVALIPGCFVLVLGRELGFIPNLPDLHQASFDYRAVGWIPGRTVTLMTLFALLSLWAYCRLCWRGGWGWGVLSLIGFAGALGSHEQAVVLPVLMAACGLAIRAKGGRFAWLPIAFSLILLELYLWFYLATIPFHTDYHQQRLRRFYSLGESLTYWLLPPLSGVWSQLSLLRDAPAAILMPAFWLAWLVLLVYLVVWRHAWREPFVWLGLIGSTLAYLPLAPVIPLMHYYYLPATFRALWIAQLLLCLRAEWLARQPLRLLDVNNLRSGFGVVRLRTRLKQRYTP